MGTTTIIIGGNDFHGRDVSLRVSGGRRDSKSRVMIVGNLHETMEFD